MVSKERAAPAAIGSGLSAGTDSAVITRQPLAESRDGKLILAPCGRSVRVLSTVTGQEVDRLQGHFAEVTAVILNPSDGEQAYTVSMDGTLRLWDLQRGAALQVHTIHHPIKSMVLHSAQKVAFLAVHWNDGAAGRVFAYDLVAHKVLPDVMRTRVASTLATGSPSGALVVAIEKHSLLVWRAADALAGPSLNLHHTKPYTCVAISADDSIVAAGDATGRIQIWHQVGKYIPEAAGKPQGGQAAPPSVLPPATTVHWHANPVGCLAFAADNTVLYSGGLEAVLVSWHLDTSSPTFLPRLGGGLLGIHISGVDPSRLLIRQDDNTMRIINMATRCVERSIFGLQPPPFAVPPQLLTGAVAVRPLGSGAVLSLPVTNAELQLYDLRHQRHVTLMQIAPRNKLPFTDNARDWGASGPPAPPHVSQVAFSTDGTVMATVDVRPSVSLSSGRGASEHCLKFWDLVNATTAEGIKAPYALNTRVEDPHRGAIRSLVYHPQQHVVVSVGGEGGHSEAHTFRIWTRTRIAPRPGSQLANPTAWHCRCVGSYMDHALGAASFSSDGSVLAVAAGPNVTLWDPLTCELAAVLAPGNGTTAVQHLAFVHGTQYLVAASAQTLMVWDILTTALHWSRSLSVCDLAVDPLVPGTFAVAAPYHPQVPRQQATAALQASAAAAKARVVQVAGTQITVHDVAKGKAAEEAAVQDTRAARLAEAVRPACSVMVFNAESPMPSHQCTVPNAASVMLRYGPPDLLSDASSAPSTSPPSSTFSPLIIITGDRRIVVGSFQGAGESEATLRTREAASTRTAARVPSAVNDSLENGDAGDDDDQPLAGPSTASDGIVGPAPLVLTGQMGRLALGNPSSHEGTAPDPALLEAARKLGLAGRREVVMAARHTAMDRRRLEARMGGAGSGEGGAVGAAADLAQRRKALLDAPSHMLPRASATALAFLELFG